MQSLQASIGMLVRVKAAHWKSGFGGMVGVIEGSWGSPEYAALDVRFEDGRSELFWFHELDAIGEEAGLPARIAFYDGS
jgi:hypothetical protein